MTMLNTILLPIIKKNLSVTSVFDVIPQNPAFPYVLIKSKENKGWANLTCEGVESTVVCEIYSEEINLTKMIEMILIIKQAFADISILIENPEVVYINFNNYQIKQKNLTLVGVIYFRLLMIN